MNEPTYDFMNTLPDLDGGVFLEKLSRAMKDAAIGVVAHGDNGKKAKVTMEITMQRIGESSQVAMTHKLKYDRPTRRGKSSEEDVTETPLYVTQRGGLSIMPDNQNDWIGEKE